jgi:hypothetical protein
MTMHPCDSPEAKLRVLDAPRRNHFFYGKRMDVQHFQLEQDYGKLKQWLLNRLTQGKGVLCGLKVGVDGTRLCVDPGVAIDGLGREIVVPVRQCIDPASGDGGCCVPCCDERGEVPVPAPPPGPTPPGTVPPPTTPPTTPPAAARNGRFTLWLCYKECHADYQPVLVADCQARAPCAPGTVVESFCLKLEGDPDWCARLWGPAQEPPAPPPGTDDPPAPPPTEADALQAARASRRHLLCELLDRCCDPPEGDPCVPLATLLLSEGRIEALESCVVRPRLYSNAVLLDLILCLAERIEQCCDDHTPPPPLLRVAAVEFLADQALLVVGAASPLQTTEVPIRRNVNAIRIRFTAPFGAGAQLPTTHESVADPDFKRHAVQVLPEGMVLGGLPFVPGSLVVLDAQTLRFDLNRDSPYVRAGGSWQKGLYRLRLAGDADAGAGRQPIVDGAGKALDGEAIAPADGAMSGNGTAGGDFTLLFNIT